MNINLRDIDYFAVLAQHGHMGRAAEALGLGQPALSMSLRRLETSLQARLVKRTPKGVELTAIGSMLLTHVRRLHLARDDTVRELADLSHGRAGQLRIGVSPGLPEEIAGVAAGLLMKEAPKLLLQLSVVSSDGLLASLRQGRLDLAVCIIPSATTDGLVHELLLEDEFAVYASRDHRLARRKRLTLADLASESWAKSATAQFPWEALHKTFEERGLQPPRIAVESDSTPLRLHAVASSDLLGFISRPFLMRAAPRLRLVELRIKEAQWPRRIGVSHRNDGYVPSAARRAIEILKSTARQFSHSGRR